MRAHSYQDFGTRNPTAIEMHQGETAQGNLLTMPPPDQLDSNNSFKVDQVSCGNPGFRMHHGTWPFRNFWSLGPRYRTFLACSLLVVAAVGCGQRCSGGPVAGPSGVQLHSGSWPQLHPAASTFQLCFVGVCSTGSVNSVIFVSTQGSSALSGRASLRAFNVAHKSLLDTSSMVRLAKRESRGCTGPTTVTWGAFVQLADNGVLSSPGS